MRGRWIGVLAVVAGCTPPLEPGHPDSTGTSEAGPTTGSSSGVASSVASSTGVPPSTFGMDAADDSHEAGFVGPLDLACAAAAGVSPRCALCDVREDGCIDDFKCVPWAEDGGDAWNGTKCIGTPLVPVGVGEACTVFDTLVSGRDDCVLGSMCWDADPTTLEGVCVPFCAPEGDDPLCPAGTQCMIDGPEVLALCLPTCHPLDPSTCPADATCRFMSKSAAAFCIPDDGGRVLAPTIQCGDDDEACTGAQVCVTAATYGGCGSPSCCTAWCDLGQADADAQCAVGRPDHECLAVFDRGLSPQGYEDLGICAVP